MQVDGHGANLGQQDIETLDRLVFELRKHKGFELTVFLEAFWKEHLSTQLKREAIESLSWRKA